MAWDSPIDLIKLALELGVLAVVIYAFIRFIQETQGSAVFQGFVVMLIVAVIGVPLLSRFAELEHLNFIARHGTQIIVLGLVVIFSQELRQALVRLGESRLFRGFGRPVVRSKREVVDEIIQAAERLSRRSLGALIIVERQIGIASFTAGGVEMDALVSAPLLVSIFFKDTPLHDGAIVVRGRRIVAAGCVLPLSESQNIAPTIGTRHRAGVGATEENDAIAIIVSEETQKISVARRGQLERGITSERLAEILRDSGGADAEEGAK